MKQLAIISTLLLFTACHTQKPAKESSVSFKNQKALELALTTSDTLNKQTFDLKLRIKKLTDASYYLILQEDGRYRYVYASRWDNGEESILKKGRYEIVNNRIILSGKDNNSDLNNFDFYLVTSDKNLNDSAVDCIALDSRLYCLYRMYIGDR